MQCVIMENEPISDRLSGRPISRERRLKLIDVVLTIGMFFICFSLFFQLTLFSGYKHVYDDEEQPSTLPSHCSRVARGC
jgi:hypothetical protein